MRRPLVRGLAQACCLATLLATGLAGAQITGVTALKNAGNTADLFVGPPAFTSYQIESAVREPGRSHAALHVEPGSGQPVPG